MIRFIFRWAFRMLILCIVLVVALILLKDTLLKSWLKGRVEAGTGLELRIGRLESGLFSPTLTAEDVVLYNPAEFGGSPLVNVRDLRIEADPSTLFGGPVRFKLVRIDLSEINVVESRAGRTNVVDLLARLERILPASTRADGARGADGFAGIDTLNLSFGKVRYSNLRQPGRDTEFSVGLKNEIVQGVRTVEDLNAVVLKVLFRKGITIQSAPPSSKPTAPKSKPAKPRP